MLYNKQEMDFKIKSVVKHYYWQDIMDFYMRILSRLNHDWDKNIVDLVRNFRVK